MCPSWALLGVMGSRAALRSFSGGRACIASCNLLSHRFRRARRLHQNALDNLKDAILST